MRHLLKHHAWVGELQARLILTSYSCLRIGLPRSRLSCCATVPYCALTVWNLEEMLSKCVIEWLSDLNAISGTNLHDCCPKIGTVIISTQQLSLSWTQCDLIRRKCTDILRSFCACRNYSGVSQMWSFVQTVTFANRFWIMLWTTS